MKTIIFFLISFSITTAYKIQYPNCLTELQDNLLNSPNTTTSFNLNFIELTNFLHKERQQFVKDAALTHIKTGNNKQILQIKQFALRKYATIGIIIILFILVLLILRLIFHNAKKRIQAFIDRYIGKLLNPCATILGLTLFVFLVFSSGIINDMYDNLDRAVCQSYYIDQLILNGSTKQKWLGLQQLSDNFHYLNNQFIETFREMNSSFDFSTQLMNEGIYANEEFDNKLVRQFYDGQVNHQGNSITFPALLPQFFGDQPTTLRKINSTMANLINLSKKAKDIESSIATLRLSKIYLDEKFDKVISSFDRNKENFENSEEFSPDEIIDMINENEWMIKVSQFYVFIGFQASFGYVITIYLLGKSTRQNLFKRLANGFWVCLMAEIVLSFLMAYSFDQASILAEGYCYALDELTRNSTLYNETGAARRKGEIVDSYDLIYPCLFEEGNFTIPSEIYYEHKASSKVIKNLYEYINMMDKSHKTYKDAYSIIDVLDESSSQIQNQQHNRYKRWTYINGLLNNLNALTLSQTCYNHHWVFNRNECKQGENILPSTNNNLLTIQSVSPPTSCLSFNVLNTLGQVDHTIDYAEFLSNYVNYQHANCSSQYDQIIEIGQKIISANELKAQSIEGIKDQINDQKEQINELLKYQRMDYLLKKEQYSFLLTNDNQYEESTVRKKKWESIINQDLNCSCIKQQVSKFHEFLCINFRADLNKILICVLVSTVMFSALFIVGFFVGFHQELIWTIVQTQTQMNSELNVNLDDSSSNQQIELDNDNNENENDDNLQSLQRKLTRKDTINSNKKPATVFSSQNNTISEQDDQQ